MSRRKKRRVLRGAKLAAIVSPIFTPRLFLDLQLWLDAGQGVFQESTFVTLSGDGDVVGGWQDQSGNGNHATQATTANKPTLQTGEINGRPAIRFDGVNDLLSLTTTLTQGSFNLYIVNMIDSLAAHRSYVGTGTPFIRKLTTATDTDYRDDAATLQNITGADFTVSPGLSTFHILRFEFQTASMKRYVNGALDGQQLAGGLADFSLSVLADRGGEPFSGDWAELLFYDRLLTASEDATLNTYLATKYGITLA